MRTNGQLLHDVVAAAAAIEAHLRRGPLTDGLVLDAVRASQFEIGEPVDDSDPVETSTMCFSGRQQHHIMYMNLYRRGLDHAPDHQ